MGQNVSPSRTSMKLFGSHTLLSIVMLALLCLASAQPSYEPTDPKCAPICQFEADGSMSCVSGCPPVFNPVTGTTITVSQEDSEDQGNNISE